MAIAMATDVQCTDISFALAILACVAFIMCASIRLHRHAIAHALAPATRSVA